MRRFGEARVILEKSGQRDPQNPRVWFNLGLLEKASGNAPAAIADFQKVAALDSYRRRHPIFSRADLFAATGIRESHHSLPQSDRAESFSSFRRIWIGTSSAAQQQRSTGQRALRQIPAPDDRKIGEADQLHLWRAGTVFARRECSQPAPEPVPPAMPVHFVNVTGCLRAPHAFRGQAASPWSVSGRAGPPSTNIQPMPQNTTRTRLNHRQKNRMTEDAPADFSAAAHASSITTATAVPTFSLSTAMGEARPRWQRNLGNGHFANVTRRG